VQFEWLSTPRVIEEQVAAISRLADRYGLRFVETFIGQVADASEKSPLEKPITVRFALPPFAGEWEGDLILAFAAKFDYILDLEPDYRFPADLDVRYSALCCLVPGHYSSNVRTAYRKVPTVGFQFIHSSGVSHIQLTHDRDGVLFLHNRLLIGHLEPGTRSGRPLPGDLLAELRTFCADVDGLRAFWTATTEHLVAKADEMKRKMASGEGLRTPQSGVMQIPPAPSYVPTQ
jgi:hypothetical protein